MANQAVIFGMLGAGGIMLTAAVTGSSLAQVVQGKANPLSHSPTSSGSSSGGVVTSTGAAIGTAASTSGLATHGLVTPALLKSIGAQHGWTGQQLTDWMNVIMAESNGTLTDTNTGSGAYGIAQFINGAGEYYTYGGNPDTVQGQLTAMANYIAQRYGNPANAWTFHLQNGWY